ncbi:MAG: UDP-N-acetylglucosamine 2-epimerase (non-hydrolyzing) [Planctomycetes bacterium]|nr:UDP-N-acetylglucosamine 2-epimerase (non-hydrolyzing) [Planctomycetota bacterium]
MKVVTVVGARPQFVKAAPVSRALRARRHEELLVHTGQHFDDLMSKVFFEELALPAPDVDLGVGSGPHGRQTGAMLAGVEEVLLARRPDVVLVYGDTNSTLAGALAAVKLGLPLAHVEAGLRSFNRAMPEEHNRVLTDHCADLLLCPTRTAVEHLAREGLTRGVHLVGDVMLDAVLAHVARARARPASPADALGLGPKGYLLATVHRPYNTDDPAALRRILEALEAVGEPVVLPVHPRTRARLAGLEGLRLERVRLIDPVGYLDMLRLLDGCRLVLTDSGGVQKEAYFLGVPCVTLRPETEWVETVEAGWNVLAGDDPARIVALARGFAPSGERPATFGDGRAADAVVAALEGA